MNAIAQYFRLAEHHTTIAIEIRAGITTFLTMAYILLVTPQLLSLSGMPAQDVAAATAISAAIACFLMGLYANYPFALAPGIGLTAFFTFGVVKGMGIPWEQALAAVLVEGVIFMALALTGIRTLMINAIPQSLKIATMSGIGLFLAIIGFKNAGLTVDHTDTLVTMGSLENPAVLLSFLGVALTGALMVLQVRGAILFGILLLTLISWGFGLSPWPDRVASLPHLPRETFLALDFSNVLSGAFLTVVLAFLFVDVFDTAGTLLGTGRAAGLLDENGELPRSERAFMSDAVGTSVGALMGTSTVTTYVESAAGVEAGGRTGLTAVVVGILFLLSLFLTPLFIAIPAMATAPALIVVGTLMMNGARDIDWLDMENSIPAFLTMAAMPFTFSIANGISLGIIAYSLIRLLSGKWRQIHPVMAVLTALLLGYYCFK